MGLTGLSGLTKLIDRFNRSSVKSILVTIIPVSVLCNKKILVTVQIFETPSVLRIRDPVLFYPLDPDPG
jgi:hypothetical protein